MVDYYDFELHRNRLKIILQIDVRWATLIIIKKIKCAYSRDLFMGSNQDHMVRRADNSKKQKNLPPEEFVLRNPDRAE